MATEHEHITELWKRYLADQATPEQVTELLGLLREPGRDDENDQQFREALAALELLPRQSAGPEALEEVWQFLLDARPSLQDAWKGRLEEDAGKVKRIAGNEQRAVQHRGRILVFRWWAAASVILVLGIGAYFWNQQLTIDNGQLTIAKTGKNDIAPGKDGAILTLADGTQMVLDSLGNDVIATQNGARVQLQNGQLAYDPTGKAAGEIRYNTLTTPKGRQFQIVLPDGTKVWLNAASSIRYPTVFTRKERRVEVTGEAYFEVAKNISMPFRVDVSDQAEIEVLGTSFNVNAYENEGSINTSLIEGSVKVSLSKKISPSHPQSILLKPNQQAQIINSTSDIKYQTFDITKVLAWKNGLFNFQDVSFEEAMRQLERWYDIDVVYKEGVPDNIELNGEITKGVTLNDLLVVLEKIGVKCQLDNRKLIVMQ